MVLERDATTGNRCFCLDLMIPTRPDLANRSVQTNWIITFIIQEMRYPRVIIFSQADVKSGMDLGNGPRPSKSISCDWRSFDHHVILRSCSTAPARFIKPARLFPGATLLLFATCIRSTYSLTIFELYQSPLPARDSCWQLRHSTPGSATTQETEEAATPCRSFSRPIHRT